MTPPAAALWAARGPRIETVTLCAARGLAPTPADSSAPLAATAAVESAHVEVTARLDANTATVRELDQHACR